jgi:hypothetical protein
LGDVGEGGRKIFLGLEKWEIVRERQTRKTELFERFQKREL